jgi:Uma2 family endonuclease
MNPTTAATRMTADEFYDWCCRPENENKRFELVRGEVIELPVPTKPHGVICVKVSTALELYSLEQGMGYVTGNDSGVILERDPDTVRGPDAAYYDDAEKFSELHPKYGENPPRVAVEVLSPEDRPGKVMRKIAEYLNAGVPLVWVVDPEDQSVTVHRPDRPPTVITREQDLTGDDVLPGFRWPVARLFQLAKEQKPNPPAA